MHQIGNETQQKIEKTIFEMEKKTSSELVAVVTQKSGDYLYISLLITSLISLFIPFGLLFFAPDMEAKTIFEAQLLGFMLLLLLFNVPKVLFYLLPKSVFVKAAKLKAYETFRILGLQKTSNYQAVMIFVSLYEKYIEIVADSAISAKIDNALWQKTIDAFVENVKNDKFEEGYLQAINEVGAILTQHFPIEKHDKNELPDRLIEV
ncbi:TPM domain-containing protein [Sulfurospirillum oryzae]|uniref:TPM domain-containing protein n=1 Tax=Sulfurospirillum oryzae TaxID=2976535 RepID=UPI0021E8F60C|nr:TPM domain-containing protein [Sulfurospirillum oryzae]